MSGRLRARAAALLALCLTMTPGASTAADGTGASAQYVSGGTFVARADGQPVVDQGLAVCNPGNGAGVGGFCLPFGGGDAIEVVDNVVGDQVAFQACIDNDADGICTSPDSGACADEVFFSHDDDGSFYNPLGPLPTGFTAGCGAGAYPGYVVFLCEGAHAVGADAHTHKAFGGVGTVTTGGEGHGTFCGGGTAPSEKPFAPELETRYTNGGTAVVRGGSAAVDDGAVVCNDGNKVGVGGFCVPFGGGDAIAVLDAAAGEDVAFQACVDNNGDGVCTSPDTSPACADEIAFSHDDAGNFFNPLGPLPTGFAAGCPGGPWNGYVVFICEGAHVDGALTPHAHASSSGVGGVTGGGEGLGTFCGGTHAVPSAKRYEVAPVPSVVPAPLAATSAAAGQPCRLSAVTDLTGGSDARTGTLSGELTWNQPFTLHCIVQLDANTHASSANAEAHEQAGSQPAGGDHAAVLPPTQIAYTSPAASQDYLCTSVTYGSPVTTMYYSVGDYGADGIPGTADDVAPAWSTDPNSMCGPATELDSGPLVDLIP